MEFFKSYTLYLAGGTEAAAGLIIGLAVIEATLRALWAFFHLSEPQVRKEEIRLRLGRWLAVAPELQSWDQIGKFATVLALRTLLKWIFTQEENLLLLRRQHQ